MIRVFLNHNHKTPTFFVSISLAISKGHCSSVTPVKKDMADGLQSSGSCKSTATVRPPEKGLKCPRCDSSNTKFCYYNNYSLSQPRHFCRTCRRYWTKGGALRNVPVGGGCRKNKKSKSPASSFLPLDPISGIPEIGSSLKFLDGMPTSTAMDFHIGLPPVSTLQYAPAAPGVFNFNQFITFRDISHSATFSSAATPAVGAYNEIGGTSSSAGNSSNVVSSVESLSSINTDLHWKLQQQRLDMLLGGEAHKESRMYDPDQQKLNSCKVEEKPTDDVCGVSGSSNAYVSTWFLESSYAMPPSTSIINSCTNSSTKSNCNINSSLWDGIPAWSDMPQFTTMP
ncbi:hypothetical protein B296_00008052 [Ensete ventricosum]|uniref:Dof zinc finger protein n=1 Tax=Ensete ventricosum TaxID=4639 RepID=A0A427ALV8_ENSVE|nr:hypothetical protein B296_00008052 [Ensete ventricosum]